MIRIVLLLVISTTVMSLASCASNSQALSPSVQLEVQAKSADPGFCTDFSALAHSMMIGRQLGEKQTAMQSNLVDANPGLDATIELLVEDVFTYRLRSTIGDMNTVAREFTNKWAARLGVCE